MPIQSVETFNVSGPALLTLKQAGDARGWFCETWNRRDWVEAGLPDEHWIQDNQAFSAVPGTLRGLHFQAPPHAQAKLIQAVSGEIFDAVVDIRTGSPTFGRGLFVQLSATRPQAFYVPAGFAHGYQTLSPDALVSYKVTDHYTPDAEGGLLWNDTALAIDWPYRGEVVTSERDQTWPSLSELNSPFVYKS